MDQRQRIVIIGGGFAGLNLIKHLDKKKYQITLVDRNNYHSFPPLFYQIASSGLDPGSICFPFRRELRKYQSKGVRFHMGVVSRIDTEGKVVYTDTETIPYDKLVVAAGTTNNFFGNTSLIERVFTLKSTPEAIRCRNEILDRLERASTASDDDERRRLLSFVVIGGGPTGVEVAGAIGEMKRYIMPREYPDIPVGDLTITIIEGRESLLSAMSPGSQRQALAYLQSLLVNVKLGVLMEKYEGEKVYLNDGTVMPAAMVIWTAGITGVKFDFSKQLAAAPGGRIAVDAFNRVDGLDDVFALGDIAYLANDRYPHGYPQLAQVAIQQAENLARNLNDGEFKREFTYNDMGSMATVGRNRAVVDLTHLHLSGRPAWFTWMFVHLMSLLGMRNKIMVLINWVWAYFTYSTSLRLLFLPTKYPLKQRWSEGG